MLFRETALRRRIADFLPVGALAALVAVAVAPWLRRDLRWEDIADAPNHLIRIYAIGAALQAGDWYPRWLSDLYLGYGYPLLNYYAPGLYYLAALLRGLGMTVYGSFQWSGVIAVAMGGTSAFALVRALTGRALPALFGAAIFVLSPYPFLTNLYVRAALPEALALGLLPWLLFAALRAWHSGGGWPAAFTAATALLLLTHNLSSLVYAGVLALWLACLAIADPPAAREGLGRIVPAGLLGMALTAFFWLPAFLETGYVQLDLARGGIYDFRTWLFDPLRAGPVSPSIPFDYSALGKAVPERPSLTQGLLWLSAVGVALVTAFGPGARASRPLGPRLTLPLFFLVLAAAFWFFCTTWSAPLWEQLPLLATVQFPWRLYGPMGLCLAVGAACALNGQGVRFLVMGGVVALFAFDSIAARPVLTGAEPAHDVDARDLAAKEYNRYGAGTTSGGEFLPRTVYWPVEGATRRGIRIYEEAYAQAGWRAGLVRVIEGRADIPEIWRDSHGIAAGVEAETASRVGIHQLAFPGWRGYVDGKPVTLGLARYEPHDASLGFMTVDVPAGRHEVEVRFGPTRWRHAGNALTAAALALVALGAAPTLIGPLWPRRHRGGAPVPFAAALPLSTLTALLTVAAGEWATRPAATIHPNKSVVALDVLSTLAGGRGQTRSPAGTGGGFLAPFLEAQFKRMPAEERRWLYMHPPAAATVQLRVPRDAYFQAGLALDPATWSAETGDGVRFILEAEWQGGRATLLNRHVNPRARLEERTWNDVWVPLRELAGQEVRLTLRTDPAADPSLDWAGWSSPQVVVYRAARPHPGEPHKW